MIAHIIRIGPAAIRIPLLCLLFPLDWLFFVLRAWLPPSLGGHPNRSRLVAWDFYAMPWTIFWAAWDGSFVP